MVPCLINGTKREYSSRLKRPRLSLMAGATIHGISDISHIERTMYIISSEDIHAEQTLLIAIGFES